MTLTAIRPFTLGDSTLKVGDVVPLPTLDALPPGRVEALKSQRYLREVTAESELSKRVAKLEQRIERLEARASHRRRTPAVTPPAPSINPTDVGGGE